MNLGHAIGTAVRDTVREEVRPLTQTGFWHELGKTTIEYVRTWIQELDPVRYEVWQTANDERTCPQCAPLDGTVWKEDEGWNPPIHDHCRCQRVYHHLEFNVRYVESWQRREVRTTSWQWRTNA